MISWRGAGEKVRMRETSEWVGRKMGGDGVVDGQRSTEIGTMMIEALGVIPFGVIGIGC